jgi:hypothetical protein
MWLLLVLLAVVTASAYTISYRLPVTARGGFAYDVYGYFYPNILYALRSLRSGSGGLLWNAFQNCGQPFLGITETGLFYPVNALFLFMAPEMALRGVLFVNLIIGGLGSYGLAREIGVSRFAALGSALAFMLGSAALYMTTWMPTVQAPFVWLPVAMLCCERLVKAPTLRNALLLGLALAAGLLPGHPQFVLFTCQLVALRLLWSLTDPAERPNFVRALGGVSLGFVLMLLLTAVQYFSSLQVIGESIRSSALQPNEIEPFTESWSGIAEAMRAHQATVGLSVLPTFLAAVGLVGVARRRIALFYFLAGLLFLLLSLGHATPLGELYFKLPISGLFRNPGRFRYVTGFCTAVLAGLAIDVLAQGSWRALALATASLLGLYFCLGALWPTDWWVAAAALAAGAVAVALPPARPAVLAAIFAAVALGPVLSPSWSMHRYFVDDRPLRIHSAVLGRLQKRLTPQDRIQLVLPTEHIVGFQDKTAMLFRVPAVTDYELQLSQRYAEFITMLRGGRLLQSINDAIFAGPWNPQTVSWPLLNLTAARYVVADKTQTGNLDPNGRAKLQFLDDDPGVGVYENPDALPRAYYVPQIAVAPDRALRLRRLALGKEDRRLLALVDEAPASGFLGVPGNATTAEARFTIDEPEHVVIETVAPERGYLFLADQYFPAWSARVNGQPTPILIGNHAFRLVEVPAGPVTVEFSYGSDRLWIGALISAATLLGVVVLLVVLRRRDPAVTSAVAQAA